MAKNNGSLGVFSRYLHAVTGEYKAAKLGRPRKTEAPKQEEMTAVQFLRRKKKSTRTLRERFLDVLPKLMEAEGWSVQDLRAVGVPMQDLYDAKIVEKRAGRPKGAANDT